jgi:hypothetical protein
MSKEKMMACARGSWQAEIVAALVRYGRVTNPCKGLQGRAKSYSGRYEMSWRNLRNRLREEAGIEVYVKELGPRGGMWSAVWAVRPVDA